MMNELLIILDLNGTILDSTHRQRKGCKYDLKARTKYVYFRPGMKEFIEFLKTNSRFRVAVWTSCIPQNAKAIVEHIFKDVPLEFCYSRDECDELSGPGFKTIKNLNKVWDRFPKWNQSNTFIIDDSSEKLVGFEKNLLCVPEFIMSCGTEDKVLKSLPDFLMKIH